MFALLDMDSFYAQVECKRLGLSNDTPLGVQQHGHFIAVNYAARKRGVPSRCAVDKAMEICPEIVAAEVEMLENIKPSLERYRRASEDVLRVILEFVSEAHLERASIDEAYIDLTEACEQATLDERQKLCEFEKAINGPASSVESEPANERKLLFTASTIMNRIREAIHTKLGFTSSCGIAHNKLLAKVSASKNKPAGQTIVFKSGAKHLMGTTGLHKLKGLGGKLGKKLEALYHQKIGVNPKALEGENVLVAVQKGDLSFEHLQREFGPRTARFIVSRANGEDDSEIMPKSKPKMLLSMKQFYNVLAFAQVDEWLRLESEELAKRVKLDSEQFNRVPRTIVLHVYRNDFEKISRRGGFTTSDLTNMHALQEDIHRASLALFRKVDIDKQGARGIGIGLDNFQELSAAGALSSARITKFFSPSTKTNGNNKSVEGNQGLDETFISEDELSDDVFDYDDERLSYDGFSNNGDEDDDRRVEDMDFFQGKPESKGGVLCGPFPPGMQRPQTSREAGASEFVSRFFRASRLSFIGLWKRRFESLLDTLPPPPELPKPNLGERVLLHVDMDAFFCSASLLKRPDLKDKPVGICWSTATAETSATASAAEISSCNYIARAQGVRAGMFLGKAKSLCPELTCLPFDFELYESIGMEFYRLLFELTPHVEGLSCDEAYADITHLVKEPGDVARLAEDLRAAICKRTGGVTASVGAGKNRLIARLCTARAKPNGFFSASFFTDDKIFNTLLNEDMDVGSLPNVGWSTKERLHKELNVGSVKDLRGVPLPQLKRVLGPKIGEKIYQAARGIDSRPWNPRPERDSVSVQISWGVRMENQQEVCDFLNELAIECFRRLGDRTGDTINLKVWRAVENQPEHMRKGMVGHGVCDILTRSQPKLVHGVAHDAPEDAKIPGQRLIFDSSLELFNDLRIRPDEVRGIGVSISGLAKKSFDSNPKSKKRKIATAPPTTSRWIEGFGVVVTKRYKESTSPNKKLSTRNNEELDDDDSYLEMCQQIAQHGLEQCRHIIRKELRMAFEESHCENWPACCGVNCDCFEANHKGIEGCLSLVEGLIQCRIDCEKLTTFTRWTAHSMYGTLPANHPISNFTRMGGGLCLLYEGLDDIEEYFKNESV